MSDLPELPPPDITPVVGGIECPAWFALNVRRIQRAAWNAAAVAAQSEQWIQEAMRLAKACEEAAADIALSGEGCRTSLTPDQEKVLLEEARAALEAHLRSKE